MKTLCLAFLLATEVSSCNDYNIKQKIKEQSDTSKTDCQAKGGVPIFEMIYDTGDYSYIQNMIRCDFPPPSTLRGEK